MSVEIGLISKLLETKDYDILKDKQITAKYFEKEYQPCIRFIDDFYMKNGTVPTIRIFEKKFPDIELETYEDSVGTEEPLAYWCDEIRDKKTHNTIVGYMNEVADMLDSGQVSDAVKSIRKLVNKVELDLTETTAVDTTKDMDDRKKRYEERKRNKGILGIETGIKLLDYMLKGLQPKQLITLMAKTSTGKANPLSTPVLTPKGFVPMRDIKVGSKVIGEDGKPYSVTAIYPQGVIDIYELTFSDGTTSRCSKEHLWKFKTQDDRSRNKEWRVETLGQLMKRPLKRGKSYNLCIPVNKPVEFESSDLPLNAYVLGCLLGDGGFTTDRITFTNPEKDILEHLNQLLKDWGEFTYHKGTNCQYAFKSVDPKVNKLFRVIKNLGLQGLKSNDKYIPKNYLLGSIKDRQLLLQGLFDTDGCVHKDGTYSISTSSEQLKDDIMFLCRSLGYRCTFSCYTREGVEYTIRIATDDMIFSSDKHKQRYENRVVPKKQHYYDILKIVDIKKVGQEECQCISVDSKDHTYITDDFIVTHNTWLFILFACYMWLQGYRVMFFTTEMSEEQIEDRLEAMAMGMLYSEFNYSDFKSGKLTPDQEKIYYEFLDTKKGLETFIIDTATTVSSIRAKVELQEANIVFVDSAYLMEDEEGAEADHMRVTHIFRGLKKLAKSLEIPICANTQQDLKSKGGLESVNFAKAITHESDVVMRLERTEEMIEDKEAKIVLEKQREGVLGSVMLNWNFDTMNFGGIYVSQGEKDYTEKEFESGVLGID